MNEMAIGVFDSRETAERAISRLRDDLDIDTNDISYIYRSSSNEIREEDGSEMDDASSAGEGAAAGAATGGTIGALAGLATAAGVIPVIGPIFAAGPLLAALGIGAGVVGTTAAGAVTGAAAGGVIGALVNWGVDKADAQRYEERVQAGEILVAVHTDSPVEATSVLEEAGAKEVRTYERGE
jgi:hypothetical protein